MRQTFRQYFRPTTEELQKLWKEALFAFDTSVLLNVYGYSSETRDQLVEFIEKNAARICLPYQFALEYSRDRSKVIIKQVNNYLKVEAALRQIHENDLAPKHDHPYLSASSLKAFEDIQSELAQSRKAMESLIGADPYADKLLDLFEGKVGKCPTSEELLKLHAQAKERYANAIPPGYADLKEKNPPDAYGDCIGWCQLMDIAKIKGVDVIFLTDDQKDDWWRIERDRMVGPRPELLEEFTIVTGRRCYMYTSENFLRAAKQFAAAEIGDDVIDEVSQRLASIRETQNIIEKLKARATDEAESAISDLKSRVSDELPAYAVKTREGTSDPADLKGKGQDASGADTAPLKSEG